MRIIAVLIENKHARSFAYDELTQSMEQLIYDKFNNGEPVSYRILEDKELTPLYKHLLK